MAEVAGLVIGGVALTSLFEQCINTINLIDCGRNFSTAHQDAALSLVLLGRRLSRCEQALQRAQVDDDTSFDANEAADQLVLIKNRLELAEKVSEVYADQETSCSKAVSAITEKLQGMHIGGRRDSLSLAKKARWAIFDKDKLDRLISKIDQFVTSLEKLFPNLHTIRAQIAEQDAKAVMQLQGMEGFQEARKALEAVAEKYDADLSLSRSVQGHIVTRVKVGDSTRFGVGDYYAKEWVQAGGALSQGGRHTFEDVQISGQSRVRVGNQFGGPDAVFGFQEEVQKKSQEDE